jgi:hypothetical protein
VYHSMRLVFRCYEKIGYQMYCLLLCCVYYYVYVCGISKPYSIWQSGGKHGLHQQQPTTFTTFLSPGLQLKQTRYPAPKYERATLSTGLASIFRLDYDLNQGQTGNAGPGGRVLIEVQSGQSIRHWSPAGPLGQAISSERGRLFGLPHPRSYMPLSHRT